MNAALKSHNFFPHNRCLLCGVDAEYVEDWGFVCPEVFSWLAIVGHRKMIAARYPEMHWLDTPEQQATEAQRFIAKNDTDHCGHREYNPYYGHGYTVSLQELDNEGAWIRPRVTFPTQTVASCVRDAARNARGRMGEEDGKPPTRLRVNVRLGH